MLLVTGVSRIGKLVRIRSAPLCSVVLVDIATAGKSANTADAHIKYHRHPPIFALTSIELDVYRS